MSDDVLTPEQVEAVRDAILYGHDPRQPTVAEYVALADSHTALRALHHETVESKDRVIAGYIENAADQQRIIDELRAALAEAVELLAVEVIDEDGNEMIECVVCRKRHGDHEPGCKAEAIAARQQGETNTPKESP